MAVRDVQGRVLASGRRCFVTVLGLMVALILPLLPLAAAASDAPEPIDSPPGPQPAVQPLGETELDPTARGHVTYAATANVASYQQDALVTHGVFQYAAWYASDRRVVVARRVLPTGRWTALRLDAVLWADNSHNNITLGVSPQDGRLHLALATHGPHVRYIRSVPGVLDGRAAWRSDSFEPVLGHLPGAVGAPQGWTYPTFELHAGQLLLTWRDGTPAAGRQALARYDGAGNWQHLGAFTGPSGTWRSPYGTSHSRYSYLHGFTSNPHTGDLEITWTWRESSVTLPEQCRAAPANRDLGYARSSDGGMTWVNDAGRVIGRTGSSDVITSDDDHVVVHVDVKAGMMNQESQAVDSTGRLHVLTSQLDEAVLESVGGCLSGDFYEQRAEHAQPVHHWRDADGWHSTRVPFGLGTGGRSQLVLGPDDTAFVVLPDGRIAAASADDAWSTWRIVLTGDGVDSISEQSVDRRRLSVDGVLSVLRQGTGVPLHNPSSLVLADHALSADGPAAGVDAGRTRASAASAYVGSASLPFRTTATTWQPNMPAQFLTDGDPATMWSSGAAVTRSIDGVEWIRQADATLAVGGGATRTHQQHLRVEWPSPRWAGSVTLDPGGVRGPKDWRLDGRTNGRWAPIARITGQPTRRTTYTVPRTRVDVVRLVITAGHDRQSVQVAELEVADRATDNRISFGRVVRKPRRGRSVLPVVVGDAGVVRVLRTPSVRARQVGTKVPWTVRPAVVPRGAAARKVSVRACRASRAGRVTVVVPVKVRFKPVGGKPRQVERKVRIVRTCR